eukprot:s1155_g13.t1
MSASQMENGSGAQDFDLHSLHPRTWHASEFNVSQSVASVRFRFQEDIRTRLKTTVLQLSTSRSEHELGRTAAACKSNSEASCAYAGLPTASMDRVSGVRAHNTRSQRSDYSARSTGAASVARDPTCLWHEFAS